MTFAKTMTFLERIVTNLGSTKALDRFCCLPFCKFHVCDTYHYVLHHETLTGVGIRLLHRVASLRYCRVKVCEQYCATLCLCLHLTNVTLSPFVRLGTNTISVPLFRSLDRAVDSRLLSMSRRPTANMYECVCAYYRNVRLRLDFAFCIVFWNWTCFLVCTDSVQRISSFLVSAREWAFVGMFLAMSLQGGHSVTDSFVSQWPHCQMKVKVLLLSWVSWV